jgi:hypothetical protein
LFIDHKI